MTTKTQIGDFLVWFDAERQMLRMSDEHGQGDQAYDPAAFTRSEQSQAFQIHLQGLKQADLAV